MYKKCQRTQQINLSINTGRHRSQSGYTIIELLVVIAVLSLLLALRSRLFNLLETPRGNCSA